MLLVEDDIYKRIYGCLVSETSEIKGSPPNFDSSIKFLSAN